MAASEMRYNIDKKNPNLGAAANSVHQNNNKGLGYNLCINLICMFMKRNKLMFFSKRKSKYNWNHKFNMFPLATKYFNFPDFKLCQGR